MQSRLIYQLFTGRWPQASLKEHTGEVFHKLQQFNWQVYRSFGFEWIYLLGLFDNQGDLIVTEERGINLSQQHNRLPSPFAIHNHLNPAAHLGSKYELQQLISTIREHQLKVMIDFVPNHTGLSHPWITTHPEYYIREDGQIKREFSGDVAKLDYGNHALREEMTNIFLQLALLSDGIRVDMAHLIPVDFWQSTISQAKKKNPNLFVIAEAYPTSVFDLSNLQALSKAGFDAIYHEPLYRNLKQYFSGDIELSAIQAHLNYILHNDLGISWVNYVFNHDDSLPAHLMYLEALAALILFLPGNPFIYNGMLQGRIDRLAHHYYDALKKQETEFGAISESMVKIIQAANKSKASISTVELTKANLLTCELTDNTMGINQLLLNLTEKEVQIDSYKTRYLRSSTSILKPGQAELVIDSSPETFQKLTLADDSVAPSLLHSTLLK